jgi:hypothetical protein
VFLVVGGALVDVGLLLVFLVWCSFFLGGFYGVWFVWGGWMGVRGLFCGGVMGFWVLLGLWFGFGCSLVFFCLAYLVGGLGVFVCDVLGVVYWWCVLLVGRFDIGVGSFCLFWVVGWVFLVVWIIFFCYFWFLYVFSRSFFVGFGG